jgi:hypothetical protein
MRRTALISLCLILAACGTPQEQCIARETRDLRVVTRLIAETQGNLARGYAFEEYTTYEIDYIPCGVLPTPRQTRFCRDRVPEIERRPVAIDLAAEQRKLDSLLDRRRDLEARNPAIIAACQAAYPEG